MPQGGLESLINKDPLEIKALQYDIVCNGIELSSGAIRNHNPEIMKKAFAIAGYTEEKIKKRLSSIILCFSVWSSSSWRNCSWIRQNSNANCR